MELAGSVYLYALAALGMTFATMTAIVVVLRHTTGEKITPIQLYLTRAYVETGFMVAAYAMLPMLVAVFEISQALVWRISSAAFVMGMSAYSLSVPRRYRRAAGGPAPLRIQSIRVARWILIVAVLWNAIGFPSEPGPGLYCVAVTFYLAQIGLYFCFRLGDFLSRTSSS